MIQLKVTVDGTEYILDTYKDDPINLKLQYSNVNKLQSAVGSFSQSFRIPATDRNKAAFGDIEDSTVGSTFNPKTRLPAEISVDTIPIIIGFVQFNEAIIHKNSKADYKLTFFGENINFFKALGNKKISELDLSAYNYDLTYANFQAGQAGTLLSGDVRHALFEKGRVIWDNNSPVPQFHLDEDYPAWLADLVPLLRTRKIIEAIFEEAGFTLDSTFFDSDLFSDIYTAAFDGTDSSSEPYSFYVGLTAQENFGPLAMGEDYFIEGLEDSGTGSDGDYYNDSGFYDTTANTFTPAVGGIYTATGRIRLSDMVSIDGTAPELVKAGIYDVTNGVWLQSITPGGDFLFNFFVEFAFANPPISGDGAGSNTGTYLLEAGNEYALAFQFTLNGGAGVSTGTIQDSPNFSNTELKVTLDTSYGGNDISLPALMPNIKQADFIRDMQKMFNLVFIPDNLEPTKIKVEPFDDYQALGETKDWTDYVDFNKDYTISPTADLQSKEYIWSFAEADDFIAKGVQDTFDKTYGRYKIEDIVNDFATGELEITTEHQALTLNPINESDMVVHKAIDSDGNIIEEPKAMIGFYNNETTATVDNPDNIKGLFLRDENGVTQQVDDFPYYGHYRQQYTTSTDDADLNWGAETPYNVPEAPSEGNLYLTYWDRYVEELYSDEARIMECEAYLTPVQIADIEWNDSIFIKDEYWRLLEISYSPNSNGTCKVKLIKRISGGYRPCEWTPNSVSASGLVLFEDEDGVIGTPTQSCCERYGYNWIADSCYQGVPNQNPTGSPTAILPEPPGSLKSLTVNEDYTAFAADQSLVIANTEDNDVTITLPEARLNPGKKVSVLKQVDDNVLTVSTSGGDLVDGSSSFEITGLGTVVTYESLGGASWSQVASGGPLATGANIYTTDGTVPSGETRVVTGENIVFNGTDGVIPQYSALTIQVPNINLYHYNGIGQFSQLRVADESSFASADGKGLIYADDYSAGFIDRSLVDKEYVDNLVPAFNTTNYTELTTGVTYAILDDDYYVNCVSDVQALTLPTAVGIAGNSFEIKNSRSDGEDIFVVSSLSQLIDGEITQILSQFDAMKVVSTGSGWIIV